MYVFVVILWSNIMYHEEKIINGKLMCRHTPDSEWYPKTGDYARAVNTMLRLSEEERVNVMHHFCKGCGTSKKACYCERDE